MEGSSLKKQVAQFAKDPASQINTLNVIFPALIKSYGSNPEGVTRMTSSILEALKDKRILEPADIERLFFGVEHAPAGLPETKKFVLSRLAVLFENLVAQTKEVDAFDFLSQIILANYQMVLATKKEPLTFMVS